jgi:CRP-like cAMP-binding protein
MSFKVPDEARTRLQSDLEKILPRHLAEEMLAHYTLVTYARDAFLFLTGSPADVTFWILSGMVKLYCPVGDGNRTLVRLAGPGDVVGVVDHVNGEGVREQTWEAQALTKCTAALLTRDHLAKLITTLEKAKLVTLLEHLNTAWSTWVYHYVRFISLPYRERLEMVLKDLASRFGVPDKRGTLLRIKLSHDDLAELIYSSRPTVTKLISDLIAEQVLYRHGKQYIIPARPEPARPAVGAPMRPMTTVAQNAGIGPASVVNRFEPRSATGVGSPVARSLSAK